MSESNESLFRPYMKRLAGTYTLSFGESVLELMYPFAIGLAINGLLDGQGVVSLAPLIAIWLSQTVFSAVYEMTSARVVARMYRELADKLIIKPEGTTQDDSQVTARVEMVNEVSESFTDVVPGLINGIVGIIVSAVMLFVYDLYAGLVALGLIGINALIQWRFGIRAMDLSEQINTRREGQVNIIKARKAAGVRKHFKSLTRLNVRFSDTEARTWAVADVVSLGALAAILMIIAGTGAFDAGTIFAMVTYLMTLTDSLEEGPILIEEGAHFLDVSARLNEKV